MLKNGDLRCDSLEEDFMKQITSRCPISVVHNRKDFGVSQCFCQSLAGWMWSASRRGEEGHRCWEMLHPTPLARWSLPCYRTGPLMSSPSRVVFVSLCTVREPSWGLIRQRIRLPAEARIQTPSCHAAVCGMVVSIAFLVSETKDHWPPTSLSHLFTNCCHCLQGLSLPTMESKKLPGKDSMIEVCTASRDRSSEDSQGRPLYHL